MDLEENSELLASVWKDLAALPTVSGGWFLSRKHISLTTSQRDIRQNKKRTCRTTYVPRSAEDPQSSCAFVPIGFPVEHASVSGSTPSPSGEFLAQVRNEKDKDNAEKTVSSIEILSQTRVEFSITSPKLHGDVYTSGTFGGMSWSPDGTELAFIAEAIPPKTESHFKGLGEPKDEKKEGDAVRKGDQNLYQESWGSNMMKTINPKIYVLNIKDKKVREIKGVPENLSCGHVIWTPDAKGLVFTGYLTPRAGIYAYTTRPSNLYFLDISQDEEQQEEEEEKGESKDSAAKKPEKLSVDRTVLLTPSSEDHSAKFPHFSPDGKSLVYFTTNAVQVHSAGQKLRSINWEDLSEDRVPKTAVDVVHNPTTVDQFPGFYFFAGPPARCWTDDTHLLVTTQWRCERAIVSVDINTGNIRRLPFPKLHSDGQSSSDSAGGEIALLDVLGQYVLCSVSDPVTPSAVWVFDTTDFSKGSWQRVTEHPTIPELQGLSWEQLVIEPTSDKGDLVLGFDAVLVLPKVDHQSLEPASLPPLVLIPHGGPHSGYGGWFNYYGACYLASLGFACLMINFRGSTGYGELMNESVLGVGLDALDCIDACEAVLAKSPEVVSSSKLGIIGASHGGYLTTMLIGKFPDMFKAAVAHNPVTNLAAMSAMTDIPDWCFIESGLNFATQDATTDDVEIPTSEKYSRMFENSPIAHISKVKAPVLLLLGGADARVPPLQSFDYYNILKSRGVDTKLLFYEKGQHALADTIEMAGDYGVNTALWLKKYLK